MTTKTAVAMMMAATAMITIGCGGAAHVVRRGSFSGELSLHGGTVASMDAARLAMLEHCAGRARIVSGEEAARLAAIDPGAVAKADGEGAIGGESLHYVCVTRAEAAR